MDQLTPMARTQLRFYLQFRNQPLTVMGLVAANRNRYLFLLAINIGAAALLSLEFGAVTFAFFGAVVLGALIRDFGYFRRSVLAWPITNSVLDWRLVEQALSNDEAGGESANS